MEVLKKLWRFLLFIIPITRSKVGDAKEILEYIDQGLELMEKQGGINLTHQRTGIEQLKRSI